MNEERMRILHLLGEGKITADEADRLLHATEKLTLQEEPLQRSRTSRYFYVKVEPKEGQSAERVSIKIPLALFKAGLNISKLIPAEALGTIQSSLYEKGLSFDLTSLDQENIDELLSALELMSIDVDTEETTVKVFCGP